MLKKSLLSLAVAASLGVSGCNISSTSGNNNVDSVQPDITPEELAALRGVFPVFDPANGKMPLGIDLILASASATDGTANTGKVGTFEENPITNAIDRLDGGIGVLNPIDIPFSGSLKPDSASLQSAVYLIQLSNDKTDNNLDGDEDSPLTDFLNVLDIVGIQDTDDARVAPIEEIMTGAFSIPTATKTPGAAKISVETISVDGGTNNVLRISPLVPLKPKTKYIVAILKDVQDANENKINSDVNYEAISSDEPLAIVSPTFTAVRTALNAWEQLAQGAITSVRQALDAEAPAVAMSEFALVNAFSTVSTDSVLIGMAAPVVAGAPGWLDKAVASSVKKATRENEALDQTDYPTIWKTINDGYNALDATNTISDAQTALVTELMTSTTYESSQPIARTTNFLTSLATDNSSAGLPKGGTIIQGQIKLPYYLGIPTQATAGQSSDANLAASAAVQNTLMSADTSIDDFIEKQLAKVSVRSAALSAGTPITHDAVTDEQVAAASTQLPAIPPMDADGKSYVNGRYPFAQKTGDVYAPIMIHLPDTGADSGTAQAPNIECGSAAAAGSGALCPVVIYVHGIGGNRSHSLALANGGLSAVGYASISVDLPLHGVAPIVQGAADSALLFSVDAASGSPVSSAVANDETFANLMERHFGYGKSSAGTLTPLVYDDAETETDEALEAIKLPTLMNNGSAAAFINTSNFAVTRDLMRQAVMDLLNVAASIGSMDFDGHTGPDFDINNVHVVGHSLGSIITTTFVNTLNTARSLGVATLPEIQTVSLVTPGGGLARLLENSPSFAGNPAAMLPYDSTTGLPNPEFGLLAQLATQNISQGTSTLETFLSVFQATIDGVDPMAIANSAALAGTPVLAIEIVGDGSTNLPDQTIPNGANGLEGTVTAPLGNANRAELSGTDPFVGAAGLNLTANSALAGGGSRQLLRVTKGGHSSILKASTADELLSQAFQIEAVTTFIFSGGTGISVSAATTNAADILEQ